MGEINTLVMAEMGEDVLIKWYSTPQITPILSLSFLACEGASKTKCDSTPLHVSETLVVAES